MTVPSRPSSVATLADEADVARTLLELRHDLHHALLHRDLDVFAAPHGALTLEPHVQELRDRGVVLGRVARAPCRIRAW